MLVATHTAEVPPRGGPRRADFRSGAFDSRFGAREVPARVGAVFGPRAHRFVVRHGMAFDYEKRQAMRMLQGIENGSMNAWQSRDLLAEADPALVYFVFTWLRAHYPPSNPAADGVLGRIVEICTLYPAIPRRVEEGKADSLVDWFESAYAYRDLDRRAFIDLIVEKLEG